MKKMLAGAILATLVAVATPAAAADAPSSDAIGTQKLNRIVAKIQDGINDIEFDLAETAKLVSGVATLDGSDAHAAIAGLCKKHPNAIACVTISADGVIVAAEPAKYQFLTGKDVHAETQILDLFQTKRPVLATLFKGLEGYYCLGFYWPVIDRKGQLLGAIAFTYRPSKIAEVYFAPELDGAFYDGWIMQTDGKIISSYSANSVGKNFMPKGRQFDHASFEGLLTEMIANQSGSGSYNLPPVGHADPETHEVFWKSVSLRGTELRVVLFERES